MKRFLAVIVLLCGAVSASFALTLSEIRDQVRYIVRDVATATNSTRWSDAVLNKRINIAQNDTALFTRCCYKTYYTTPTAEVAEVRKPADMVTIDRVTYINASSTTASNQYKKLGWASMPGLDRDLVSWEYTTSGIPRLYYERGDYIGLYPKPSATYVSTGCLKIDYYYAPADMTSDSAVPFDGLTDLYAYHDLLISAVVSMCLKDTGDVAGAQTYRAEYIDGMKAMRENILNKPDKQQSLKVQ